MRNLKYVILTFCLFIAVLVNAQKIEHGGKEYHVKGDKIFLNDIDVTPNLTTQQQVTIKNKLKNRLAREERISTAEKATKKAEKDLKKKKKAEGNLSKSHKKYKNDLKKYEKLKRKGKLSSEDEEKWLKKLEKLQEKIKKNKKRLKRT